MLERLRSTWRRMCSPKVDALERRLASVETQLELAEKFQVFAFWRGLDAIYDAKPGDELLRCIVCDHRGQRSGLTVHASNCIFGGGKLVRHECPACGCIFGPQKFLDQSPEMIGLDYQLLYSRYKEGDTTTNEVRTFHSLAPTMGRAYVNWGPGAWNRTIEQLRGEGWDIWGFEPSAPAAARYIVANKNALPSAIDGLFSNNVIEHFADPVAQFSEFAALLRPGARMAHSSPCYVYRYEFTRFHTLFLLGQAPHILAARTGFKVIDRTTDGEYINVVFERL